MTPLLKEAVDRVTSLPEDEQDVIAAVILQELNAERRIDFQIPEVNEVHEGKGHLHLEGGFLVFRFTILNWGVAEREWETVKVERGLIDYVRTEPGILKDKLLIATQSQRLLDLVPGDHRREIKLRTRKRDRADVVAFVERVHAWRRVHPVPHLEGRDASAPR